MKNVSGCSYAMLPFLLSESDICAERNKRHLQPLLQIIRKPLKVSATNFYSEKWSGRRGSNPLLNVCAYYGVCTNINICYELQPSRNALVYARLAGFL